MLPNKRPGARCSGLRGSVKPNQLDRLTAMDEFSTTSVIQWYEDLEDRLLEFLRFIPMTNQSLVVPSPRLASIITEACNILDSVFRSVTLSIHRKGKVDTP
jgi:hypothetical protein